MAAEGLTAWRGWPGERQLVESVRPMSQLYYDANMGMCWLLGLGLAPGALLPEELVSVKARARLCHQIDASMVTDFGKSVEHICEDVGKHVSKLEAATAASPYFSPLMPALERVSIALRLWAGCMSTAKTIAFKTRSGVNTVADRTRICGYIDDQAAHDIIFRAGVEAAIAFKRLRRQTVYLDGIPSSSSVLRYAGR
jgi:hypothetical protein